MKTLVAGSVFTTLVKDLSEKMNRLCMLYFWSNIHYERPFGLSFILAVCISLHISASDPSQVPYATYAFEAAKL